MAGGARVDGSHALGMLGDDWNDDQIGEKNRKDVLAILMYSFFHVKYTSNFHHARHAVFVSIQKNFSGQIWSNIYIYIYI